MRKSLLFVLLLLSCENPLNLNYNKNSYEEDMKYIERYDKFAAKKIEFVFYYEDPETGVTYKEILDRFPEIENEIKTKDSLLKIELNNQIKIVDELKLKAERLSNNLDINSYKKIEQKSLFIKILDDWNVTDPYRSIILEEFDKTMGEIKIGKVSSDGRRLMIDIGARKLYTLTNKEK